MAGSQYVLGVKVMDSNAVGTCGSEENHEINQVILMVRIQRITANNYWT